MGEWYRGKERTVHKDGTRSKSTSPRTKQLGLRKHRPRNGKRFRHRLVTADDGNNQQPQTVKNTCLLGTPATRQHSGRIQLLQKETVLSTRYDLVFFEDKIIVPLNLRTTVINLLHKGHPAINMMTLSAKHFWGNKLTEVIQRKCDNCIPCKLSGKSIKPHIPKTEQTSLPLLGAPNDEVQLDFIGPITDQNRRFYILLSMDRYSKWPAASLCKTADGETAIKFVEQYCNLNGIPKSIQTDKLTAFIGRQFRRFCRNEFIKLKYGTP